MFISLNIKSLQHINNVLLDFDFSNRNLICITGRNGIGKTSIVKSLCLLKDISVLNKTSSIFSINKETNITISINKNNYHYYCNNGEIDSKDIIDESFLNVELPIPYGKRFSNFPVLGNIDKELRESYIKGEFNKNIEIIYFLSQIYIGERFSSLKEVIIRGNKYYFLPLDGYRYIREDYFSSGEYFVINLYKTVTSDCKLIVVDEIDISLDASAQVRLIQALNNFCDKYKKKIIFTTHSLPIMRVLYQQVGESIFYLENINSRLIMREVSYSYIVGELFGFKDYDKYILTEDIMLEIYLKRLISKIDTNKSVKIIYIGGASNVIDFMRRNKRENFICESKHMISFLDGDSRGKVSGDNILYSPFLDIEDEFFRKYTEENNRFNLPSIGVDNCKSKYYCKTVIKDIGYEAFFNILDIDFEDKIEQTIAELREFINK
ncbi:TPA: AAA family ATPase [Proteus mirabilis]|nr:AAA family ATPase [Proteus mirabilis]